MSGAPAVAVRRLGLRAKLLWGLVALLLCMGIVTTAMLAKLQLDRFRIDERRQTGLMEETVWAKAQELAGDRVVEVAAGDVGGQALAAGLVDEVRMDVVPVVFGSGKRYFGSVDAQHLLEDPDTALQGNRVLHLRFRVRR